VAYPYGHAAVISPGAPRLYTGQESSHSSFGLGQHQVCGVAELSNHGSQAQGSIVWTCWPEEGFTGQAFERHFAHQVLTVPGTVGAIGAVGGGTGAVGGGVGATGGFVGVTGVTGATGGGIGATGAGARGRVVGCLGHLAVPKGFTP